MSHLIACNTEDAAAVLAQILGMMPAFNVFSEFARLAIRAKLDRSIGKVQAACGRRRTSSSETPSPASACGLR